MDNLKLHIQIVYLLIQIKPLECEYCIQAFQTHAHAQTHAQVRIHSDLGTYVCHRCTMTWHPIPYKSKFDLLPL